MQKNNLLVKFEKIYINKFLKSNNRFVKTLKKYGWILIIVLGLLIMVYPMASQKYYQILQTQEVNDFDQRAKKLINSDAEKRIKLATAYNQTLKPEKIGDPFSKIQKKGIAEYARMLEVHEKIGHIKIPKINQDIIIKAGTNEKVLQQGAGHFQGTSLPVGGPSTHTVITAHRGLPSARLFTDLNKMEIGDIFYIVNIKEKLAYKVDKITTVEPSDFRPIKIVKDKDYATLLTCTPYMINTHRLLVRGHRIPLPDAKLVKEQEKKGILEKYKSIFIFLIILSLLAIFFRKNRKVIELIRIIKK